jgi:SanA protein
MSFFRLSIVIGLFLVVAGAIWRLQKVRGVRLFTRIILLPGILLLVILASVSTHVVAQAANGKLYDDVDRIPARETALVLGVNKRAASRFFSNRIDAATVLFTAGKVRTIIVSGASRPDGYDEAADMRQALIKNGVPESAILMDAAGENTRTAIKRCKEVYGRKSITIVSQRYHVARGVYIASKLGMDAIGFSTGDVGRSTSPREYLSRTKAVFFTNYR